MSNQRQRETKRPLVPDLKSPWPKAGPEPPISSTKEKMELRKRREDSGGALEQIGVRVLVQPKPPRH